MANNKKINEPFTAVPNSLIDNKNISTCAKGMFLYLCSKPENWSFSESKIAKQIKENETFIKRVLKELESFGYLERKRIFIKGQNKGMEYILNPTPNKIKTNIGKPNIGKPNIGKPNIGKPIQFSNKDFSNKEINKEIERELSAFDFLKINFPDEFIKVINEWEKNFEIIAWENTIEKFNNWYLNKNVSIDHFKKWISNEKVIKLNPQEDKNKIINEPAYMSNRF